MNVSRRRSWLSTAATLVMVAVIPLALSACSGGGGGANVRPSTPPPPSTTPSPPPPTSVYTQNENQLVPTGALAAQQAGFTGAGVKVALTGGWDNQDITLNGTLAPNGKSHVVYYANDTAACLSDPSCNPATYPGITDGGHDEQVAEIVGGNPNPNSPNGGFAGGVAPGALLYLFDTCTSSGCNFPNQSVANAMVAQGVQVVNESLEAGALNQYTCTPTGSPGCTPQNVYADYNTIDQTLAAAGILQVISTGDQSSATSVGVLAGLPAVFPSLQPYIIAVTGVDINASGQPVLASNGADPCLEAADWCLSAPVQVYNVYNPTTSPNTYTGSWVGTSESAPIVTGVAAQVLQAFPWMQAPQLSQTLLTTATPISDGSGQTPNPTFGWGMVNAAKAVHGPSQFLDPSIYGAFLAPVPTGMTSVFSNDISGPGGLTVDGAGTLSLTGTDTYAGATEIASGTLAVNGSITSATTVDTAGTLAGTGTVNASVVNNGTVESQGSTAGQGLSITGNLTDGSSSTTAVALGTSLSVGGTASLAGTMEVLGAPANYTVQSNETLLNAGLISGTFANLNFAAGVFYTGVLSYTATAVDVALTQSSVAGTAATLPMATSQTLASAGNVQQAINVANAWMDAGPSSTAAIATHAAWFKAAGQFLSAPSSAAAASSLNSISGEIYATGRAIEAEQSLAADSAMADRQATLGTTSAPGVWVQALGANGGLARSGYDAAAYHAGGVMAGADMPIGGNGLYVGVAAGRVRSDANMQGLGGTIDANETLVGAYARWNAGNHWYSEARISDASADNTVARTLLLGSSLVALNATHTDHIVMGTLEGGKTLTLGGNTVTPYASISAMRIAQPAFAESGSALGLASPAQHTTTTFGTVGLRFGRAFQGPLGPAQIQGYVADRHAFSGTGMGLEASYVGMSGVSFTAQGQNLPRNTGILGLNATTALGAGWRAFLDADYQFGSAGSHQAEATVGARWSF